LLKTPFALRLSASESTLFMPKQLRL